MLDSWSFLMGLFKHLYEELFHLDRYESICPLLKRLPSFIEVFNFFPLIKFPVLLIAWVGSGERLIEKTQVVKYDSTRENIRLR